MSAPTQAELDHRLARLDAIQIRRGADETLFIHRIEIPADAPEYVRAEAVALEDGFDPELRDRIRQNRDEVLEVIHRAVMRHLDRCALYETDTFPCRQCLTGEYYLGNRAWEVGGERFRDIVKARLLGWSDPWNRADRGVPVEYLGIDVDVTYDPETDTFEGEAFSLQVI